MAKQQLHMYSLWVFSRRATAAATVISQIHHGNHMAANIAVILERSWPRPSWFPDIWQVHLCSQGTTPLHSHTHQLLCWRVLFEESLVLSGRAKVLPNYDMIPPAGETNHTPFDVRRYTELFMASTSSMIDVITLLVIRFALLQENLLRRLHPKFHHTRLYMP